MLVTQTHIKLPMLTYSNKTNGPPVLMLVLNVNVSHTLFMLVPHFWYHERPTLSHINICKWTHTHSIKTEILRYVNAQIYGD